MLTPRKYRTDPASTVPASLAGGDTSRTSSMRPTRKTTPPARTTPRGSEDPWKTGAKAGSWEATPMAARKARNMAAPPAVGVGFSCTRRSSGRTTAPNRTAARRTAKVSSQVPTAAVAKTTAKASMEQRPYLLSRVRRELRAQVGDLVLHRGQLGAAVPVAQGVADQAGDLAHLVGAHARGRGGRGAEPQPAGDERGPGIVGHRVLVGRDPRPVEHLLGDLPGEVLVEGAEVDEEKVVVGPARDEPEALGGQAGRQGPGVDHDPPGVLGEVGLGRFVEGDRLGRHDVL